MIRHIVLEKRKPSIVMKVHGSTLCGREAWDGWYHFHPTHEQLRTWEAVTCKTCLRAWKKKGGMLVGHLRDEAEGLTERT